MTQEETQAAIERRNAQTKDIFEKAAQEALPNPSLVGRSVSFSNYNLHNYRLYFAYKKPSEGLVGKSVEGRFRLVGTKNYGSETIYEHIETSYKVTIKKTQAEVRKKHDERDWHLIDNSNPEQITEINQTKRAEATRVFKAFIEEFGGQADFNPINEYKLDNAVKNKITKELPIKAAWEDEISKKLYMEDKIEFKNEVSAKNFCHNTGLHDFSPIIADKLDKLDRAYSVLDSITKQIEIHLEVENRTNELLKSILEERQGIREREDSSNKSPLFSSSNSSLPNTDFIDFNDFKRGGSKTSLNSMRLRRSQKD